MVVLGRIVAPYGVKGWVHVHPFADDPLSWARLPSWCLAADPDLPADQWRQLEVEQSRQHGAGLVVKLIGIHDRPDAEALSGSYVGAPRDALPVPATGEYYWSDLVGLEVVNTQGQSLGRVVSLIETGANDVLVVEADGTERLLPFVASVINEVDIGTKLVRVDWDTDW